MIAAAVVNVRMGSTRLPGKALREIDGKPLLRHIIDRLGHAKTIDRLIVATSTLSANDAIASFCKDHGVACFRGSESDVLARTLGALQYIGAELGIVVYGDGPLIDPGIVDEIVGSFLGADPPVDFVGNDLRTTYPPGMEVEAFSVAALADANHRCEDSQIREHGTLYMRLNPQLYRLRNLDAPLTLRRPDLELEIDVEDDLQVVEAVLDRFRGRSDFTLAEIISYLDTHPEIAAANSSIPRRWKTYRSDV